MTLIVLAPALDRAVTQTCTAAEITSYYNLGSVTDPTNSYRGGLVGLVTVTELTIRVIAPALDCAVTQTGTAVSIASGNLGSVADPADSNRCGLVARGTVAELAIIPSAPALYCRIA